METWLVTILLFGFLLLGLLLGLPLAFSFGGVAILFSLLLWGPKSLAIIPITAYEDVTNYILLAVPLFVFMANILEHSGIAEELYDMMHKWMGKLSGGLAIGTVVICTIFAAMAGISGVATITMGLIALPSMLSRGYSKYLAVGSVSAGGTLGILIPPSVIMILYAFLTEESVGKLFMAGILPGILITLLFIGYIALRCLINPEMGPAIEEKVGFKEKIVSLRAVVLPLLLIGLVLGVIYAGVCTPTEASAVGAFGAVICAVIHGKFTWKVFTQSLERTLLLTCMVMWILIGATCFTQLYTALGAPDMLNDLISGLYVSKWLIIGLMMIVFFILGMFMDPAGIIMICTPVFIPIVKLFGFDTIWFGILFTICMEMGYITPPFGFNLFYMRAIVPEGVSMADIYRSIIPFVLLEITGLIIVVLFPALATWLPSRMIQ
ncbi:MAG: TRAP transporter large permease subunit [Deltaproteobacteria bacterium]|nr:TRAP transporter large permease subunit [Deltaproteobacteria bacterium]MBW1950531.1 TRAP transporter large permease subunit [Deltaproteobacteria bacterium]MBW2008486.1 TRAP transporter large permease subunit [Deltaproteobacteria bacterium]MBW2347727.1 TRAP transporter large permease subunit [Deltaproteobacteria bacterium]